MRTRVRFAVAARLCAVLLLATFAATPARAWQSDVHYGVVKWLAVKAGFARDRAETVAAASEAPDRTTSLDAVKVSFGEICPRRRIEASRHVQDYHFPGDAPLPAPPDKRIVTPGYHSVENGANRRVRQELAVAWPGVADETTRLYRFGLALHPLADSWSHQGEPGIYRIGRIGCDRLYAWGHPGDPGSSKADFTYLRPKVFLEAAETLYEFLKRFAATFPAVAGRAPGFVPPLFAALYDPLRQFAEADTIRAKYDWFLGQDAAVPYASYTTYPCFVREIGIPRGRWTRRDPIHCADQRRRTVRAAPRPVPAAAQAPGGPDGALRPFLESVLRRWVVERDYGGLVKDERFDWGAIRSRMLGRRAEIVSRRYGDRWAQAILAMWLVRDHGVTESLGHGQANADGIVALIDAIEKKDERMAPIAEAKEAGDVIRAPRGEGDYDLAPLPEGYLAAFQFRHAPRYIVVLEAQQGRGGWRIRALDWMAQ